MEEVRAAMKMATKNRMDARALRMGACCARLEKIKGSVSKMSVGPAPGSIPAEKTAGMMEKPARRAKERSLRAVPTPATIRFSLFLT